MTCVWAACSPPNDQNSNAQQLQETPTREGTVFAVYTMGDDLLSFRRAVGPAGGRKNDAVTAVQRLGITEGLPITDKVICLQRVLSSHTRTSSLDKHRVSTYYVPGMLLGFGDAAGNERDGVPPTPRDSPSSWGNKNQTSA